MPLSKRFQERAERPINKDSFVTPWPEVGLDRRRQPLRSRNPSLRMEAGRVVEMDGVPRARFGHARPVHRRPRPRPRRGRRGHGHPCRGHRAHAGGHQRAARRASSAWSSGCTPAKLVEIVRHMNVLEMMMAWPRCACAARRPTRRTSPTGRSTRRCWPPTPPRRRCAALPRSRPPSAWPATRRSTRWRSWSARRRGAAAC